MNPKSSMKSGCLLVSATAFLFTTSIRADTPGFVLGSVSTNQPESFTGTKGWQFGPHGDILITQLGVFDSDGDGLVNPHPVGLWRDDPGNLTGTLLASATVLAGTDSPLMGGYRWVSISPVSLHLDLAYYVIAAQYSAGDADDLVTPRPSGNPFQFAPAIGVFLGSGRVGFGSDLPYPGANTGGPCEGCPGRLFFEPNLQYSIVPEPSSWLLLAPGLLYLFLRRLKHC